MSNETLMSNETAQTEGEPKLPQDDSAPRPARADDPVSDSGSQPGRAAAPPAAETDETLRLQPRLVPRSDGLYYVHEILGYHDEAFVEAAFASVLCRHPSDEEFWQTLGDLRGGAREKIDILRDLARSPEGKSQAAFERIAGLKRSRLAEFASGVPVVGHLWRIVAAVVRLPTALRHQRQFEAYALAQHQRIADYLNSRRLGDLAASQLQVSIADASAAVSMLSDAMAEMRARHAGEQSRLARHVGEVTLQLEQAAAQLGQAARRLDETERRIAGHDARLDEHARWIEEAGRGFAEHGRQLDEYARRLDAQQEFIVREQQAVVEAQKAALALAEEGLRETAAEQQRELAAISARVDELRAAVEAARESVGGKV